ncbi:MAG: YfiR family protein [Candidatus Zixiibacteriota bacterium]
MYIKNIISVIIITILGFTILWAQEMPVPVDLQYSLFLRILTFDRNLKARVGEEIVVGVVYQKNFRESINAKDEFTKAMDESPIKQIEDIPIRKAFINLNNTDLDSAVSQMKINILYITPLRTVKIKDITKVSQIKQLITLTGVPDYVVSGLAVGIGTKGDKPLIIINLPATKKEGADFSSQLLQLAKVVE